MRSTKSRPKRLDWSLRSLTDRRAIWDYIGVHDKNPINAELVDSRIQSSSALIEIFLQIGIPWKSSRRLYNIPKTQYTLVYRVMASSIRILRISHQKQKTP